MKIDSIKLFRLKEWWQYLIPNYLGILFIQFYCYQLSFSHSLLYLGLFFIILFSIASFGYLLNEITDLKDDLLAGKRNRTLDLSYITKTIYLFILLLCSFIPWWFLPFRALNFGLFMGQILLLLAYSVKPVRLKRYAIPGVITDALYSSVIMAFVIITTFIYLPEIEVKRYIIFGVTIFINLFLKGLRGILLHQLADRKNDRKTNSNTFVLQYGPLTTSNIINRILLPLELMTITILVILLSGYIPGLIWLYLTFLLYKALKLRCWNIWAIIKWDHRFMFLYVLNDLYEEWIPLYLLVMLTIREISFGLVLIPYIILFPAFFKKLFKDVPETVIYLIKDFRRKFYPNKVK